MKWPAKIQSYLRQKVKYTASDPNNFEVLWTFRSTRVQLYSLILVLLILFAVAIGIFVAKGPLASYFSKNDVSIERSKLEEQNLRIQNLNAKLREQEKYLVVLKSILNGETIDDTSYAEVPEAVGSIEGLDSEPTSAEKEISGKVKDDLRTVKPRKSRQDVPFFSAPVTGVISQPFSGVDHPGIDVVTSRDKTVLSCLSGTVIYSGYTRKDGHILIIDHANGYISVYKHNKAVFKKAGDKVQLNDPIGVVGNTGENSSGPHLHFELWYNQSATDPTAYINFKN